MRNGSNANNIGQVAVAAQNCATAAPPLADIGAALAKLEGERVSWTISGALRRHQNDVEKGGEAALLARKVRANAAPTFGNVGAAIAILFLTRRRYNRHGGVATTGTKLVCNWPNLRTNARLRRCRKSRQNNRILAQLRGRGAGS